MILKEQLISLFEKKLKSIASPSARNDEVMGYEVVALEIFKDKRYGQRVQLFIDRLDGSSVTADDCATVTRLLKEELDQSFDDYIFEVSSPGLNRPLTKPEHFIRFIGSHIRFNDEGQNRSSDKVQKREGVIKNANSDGIELETGENISYQRIKDAKLHTKLKQERKNDRKKSQ